MNLLQLGKVFHALFLFIREMWLRDRTFRQFVRENLSFILVSVGFAVMTFLFVNLYVIVKDQESQIAVYEQRLEQTTLRETTIKNDYQEKIDWWKARYEEKPQVAHLQSTPVATNTTTQRTRRRPSDPPAPPATSAVMLDRWKRLNQ